jgi:hypothetical protein
MTAWLEMPGFDEIYIFFFAVGLLFTVASFLLGTFGGASGGSVDAHAGDLHVDTDTVVHAAGDLGDHTHHVLDSGGVPFRPWSIVTICMFATAFGGVGYLGKNTWELETWQHLAAATGIATVLAWLTMTFFNWALRKTQMSSAPRPEELRGVEAVVDVAIPANGLGRIIYILRGARFSAPARDASGFAHAEKSKVLVVNIENGTAIVRGQVASFR